MIRRSHLVSLLVSGSILMSGNAFAHWQISATTGLPADSHYGNGGFPIGIQHWRWFNDVFVSRITSTPVPRMDWMIPIVFWQQATSGNLWSVQVMASANVPCNLVWKSDVQGVGGASTTPISKSTAGLLDLTGVDALGNSLCPGATSWAPDCITTYANAYVVCNLGLNDFVGPVLYSITPH
jgi:hypothetical protein